MKNTVAVLWPQMVCMGVGLVIAAFFGSQVGRVVGSAWAIPGLVVGILLCAASPFFTIKSQLRKLESRIKKLETAGKKI